MDTVATCQQLHLYICSIAPPHPIQAFRANTIALDLLSARSWLTTLSCQQLKCLRSLSRSCCENHSSTTLSVGLKIAMC